MFAALNLFLMIIIPLHPAHGLPFECSLGFWGSRCDKVCGQCEGGPEFCHVHDGRCVNGCGSGFHGARCRKACPPGTHGQYCVYTCGNCSNISPICDVMTGECRGGCTTGFQKPFCKLPCPFGKWGDNCERFCMCPERCGCHPISGDCEPCDVNGKPITVVLEDPGSQCINPFIYEDLHGVYVAKTVLDIPWIPIASFMGLIAAFVLSNFVYWYCWVRVPSKKEVVRVVRGKKPQSNRVEPWDQIREQIDGSTKGVNRPRQINFRNQELGQSMDHREVHLQKALESFKKLQLATLLEKMKDDPHYHHHHHHHQHHHHQHHHHQHEYEEKDPQKQENWFWPTKARETVVEVSASASGSSESVNESYSSLGSYSSSK